MHAPSRQAVCSGVASNGETGLRLQRLFQHEVLLQELGEDLVLPSELVLKLLDEKSVLAGGGRRGLLGKSRCSLLKQFLLPAVEQAGIHVVLLTKIAQRYASQQVLAQDCDFLPGSERSRRLPLDLRCWPRIEFLVIP